MTTPSGDTPGNISQVRTIINENDLLTTSTTQTYPLGLIIETQDSNATNSTPSTARKRWQYIYAPNALTMYEPYQIIQSGTAGQKYQTGAFATSNVSVQVGIPQIAFPSGGVYGFVQIEGDTTSLVTATTLQVGDFLKAYSISVALEVDGSSGSTTLTQNSVAISLAAATSITSHAESVYLLGSKTPISSS